MEYNFVMSINIYIPVYVLGSENNAVYVYTKQVSNPMLTYQYNTPRGILVRIYHSSNISSNQAWSGCTTRARSTNERMMSH